MATPIVLWTPIGPGSPADTFPGDGAKRDDEGYFWLLGRVDDIMLVSGHNISTTEVESALVSHPAVAEAAVVGRKDDITGQAIAAFVTLRGKITGDEALLKELRDHVAATIGPIAKPKSIVFTPDLPKTRSGKDHAPLVARHLRESPAWRRDDACQRVGGRGHRGDGRRPTL